MCSPQSPQGAVVERDDRRRVETILMRKRNDVPSALLQPRPGSGRVQTYDADFVTADGRNLVPVRERRHCVWPVESSRRAWRPKCSRELTSSITLEDSYETAENPTGSYRNALARKHTALQSLVVACVLAEVLTSR